MPDPKDIAAKIEQGMTRGSEIDLTHKEHAKDHTDGGHLDYSYLEQDDESHLDVPGE